MNTITANEIIEKYSTILLDAYGVLVDKNSALPGAKQFIERLNTENKSYLILTNDASKQPGTLSRKYARLGLEISEDKVIPSGSLLSRYFADNNLQGCKCLFLGSEDSRSYVGEAGGKIVPFVGKDTKADVLVICDGGDYPFIETIDLVLSTLFATFDRGENIKLVLPNPDYIYPKAAGYFGMTSGSVALIIENALRLRYPQRDNLSFVRLGKPNKFIYEEAFLRCGTKDMVMVGDQMLTDIKGAYDFGIDSALIGTGVANLDELCQEAAYAPTYLLKDLL
ncbi:HAD-IIA family hydrolase [Candidatus Uabimicrobium amorphum]|uniref:HAD-IIA family hydrolase n=1 Tax=Uabimicrobium amorphum TaxID=2596890 RepID=UPI0015649160|nr:HAD-IA family hydrolase [Candidatus Uabimicrobium amorphum]